MIESPPKYIRPMDSLQCDRGHDDDEGEGEGAVENIGKRAEKKTKESFSKKT